MKNFFHGILLLCVSIYAGELPIGSSTVQHHNFRQTLDKTWEGLKKRSVDPYSIPSIHRPKSEYPHDFVSEGIGYGMIIALYSNDQAYFNKIWNAGEEYMWNGDSYDWQRNKDGGTTGITQYPNGPATDAEIDIATMLIFADALVKKGLWQNYTSSQGATYASRAQNILDAFYGYGFYNGILKPGGWGGSVWNPGYFAPAFFKVFKAWDSNPNHDWDFVIDKCYSVIAQNPGYGLGMVPDWASSTGSLTPAGPGYNAFLGGDSFYKDAIRILWRTANDYAWFGDERAKALLENAIAFIKTPDNANFYNLDGSLYPLDDAHSFTLGNGVTRYRREHSHLTVGMWLTTIVASEDLAYQKSFVQKMNSFYEPNADYWGFANDPINQEDTLHNEMYFDQFLAWFGASLVSGHFQNVLADIDLPQNQRAVNQELIAPLYEIESPFSHSEQEAKLYDSKGSLVSQGTQIQTYLRANPGVYFHHSNAGTPPQKIISH